MQTDLEYKESKALSQSQIKSLLFGVGLYQKLLKEEEEETYFLIGDAVDILLTQGEEVFNSYFYVSKIDKPSDTIMNIVNYVFNRDSTKFNNTQSYILEACDFYKYQTNWKHETRIFKVIELGEAYWKELTKANGRTILDVEDYSTITKVVTSLKTHRFTKEIFEKESLNQLAIYFDVGDVACKALLDRVNIDHEAKTLQPIDIKTIGDYTKSFKYNAQRFRYDIQAAFYTEALSYWKTYNYTDDTILPFQFAVESTKYPGFSPLIFTCTQDDLRAGKYGVAMRTIIKKFYADGMDFELDQIERHYKGFLEGLELYKWYEENSYDLDKEIVESKGNLTLDIWS